MWHLLKVGFKTGACIPVFLQYITLAFDVKVFIL